MSPWLLVARCHYRVSPRGMGPVWCGLCASLWCSLNRVFWSSGDSLLAFDVPASLLLLVALAACDTNYNSSGRCVSPYMEFLLSCSGRFASVQ